MAFLTEEDYISQIRDETLNDLTEFDADVRTDAELRAQAEMEAYLRDRYNVGDIFEATGTSRNALIVMYLIDIALYHMYSAVTPSMVPQIRVDRYNAAMKWLDMVRRGQINPALPPNQDTDGNPTGTSIFGGNTAADYGNW